MSRYVNIDVDLVASAGPAGFRVFIGDDEHLIPRWGVLDDEDYGGGDRDVSMQVNEDVARACGLTYY